MAMSSKKASHDGLHRSTSRLAILPLSDWKEGIYP